MVAPRRLKIYLVALVAGALLAACGGAPAAIPPTAAPEPTAKPTSTPRPTAKPEPTAEPTTEPTAEPTAGTGDLVTQKIDMSDSATYSYKTGIFSIDIPGSWSADDRSSPTEVLVRFTDTSEDGVVLVNLIESQEKKSEEELVKLLTDYLENTYSKQAKFSHDNAKPQSDGSVLVVWGYDVTLSSGKTVRLLGNSFIEQRDNLVSLLTLALPDEQFDGLKPDVDTILNSYKIDSSIAIDAVKPFSPYFVAA